VKRLDGGSLQALRMEVKSRHPEVQLPRAAGRGQEWMLPWPLKGSSLDDSLSPSQ
jgi:hypothetical protein